MRNNLIFLAITFGLLAGAIVWKNNQSTSEIEIEVVEEDEQREIIVAAKNISDAPDFSLITDIQEKKSTFFDYLKPGVALENARIIKERSRLEKIQTRFESGELTSEDTSYAKRLGDLYHADLSSEGVTEQWLDRMFHRVDVLPEALVLTQAAKESGWGTSRFATKANNYFGQWCYSAGCGVVPEHRTDGMTHEVAKFSSVQESIHRYFMNVNRNRAYQELRDIRFELHSNNQDLLAIETALELTNGLIRYSERGEPYVLELQSMIRFNQPFWSK
ncbi:glucosaminidase domain-containing protein [Vibrio kyushuensis]|uniref:glucosaminidase domain-containing protein n=1 Tax=Vibrio kyushuensis TaxID=2910249 RepID=UPI003D1358FE